MDISGVYQLISSVGFPIAMCVALFWKMDKQDKEHKEETEKMAEAINNNTLAITKLVEHMSNE